MEQLNGILQRLLDETRAKSKAHVRAFLNGAI